MSLRIPKMMSEKEVAIRTEYMRKIRHPTKHPHEQEKIMAKTPMPTEDPELTIRVAASTIEELKQVSWSVSKSDNEHTMHLIKLCHKCGY